jgi:hypothetical protein
VTAKSGRSVETMRKTGKNLPHLVVIRDFFDDLDLQDL